MKRFLSLALTGLVLLSALTGCSSPANTTAPEDEGKLRVVSTIFPGYDFARAVGGDNIALSMLLSPGSESHSFDPTPQDIIRIMSCDVFIYGGGESDTWIKGILDSMDTSDMTVLAMMDLVDVVEEEIKEGMETGHSHDDEDDHEEAHDDHGHDEEPEYDEHVWTSPINAMRITRAISDAFRALDSVNAAAYRENTDSYIAQLEALDADFRQVVSEAKRNTLIFGDRFPFRYFVDEYGLDYFAAYPGCSTETAENPKTVKFLIEKTREENIPVVFFIEFSNERMADTICEESGAKKLLLHSCHNVTKEEFESGITYIQLMEQNVLNLKEALI